MQIIAEIRDYDGFTAALRGWIAGELGTTYECIDALAGFQSGYLAKMIAATPVRSFSRMSLGATLRAVGCKLLLAVDTDQLAAMRPRYKARSAHGRRIFENASDAMLAVGNAAKSGKRRNPLAGNPALAAFYAHRRAAIQSPRRRRAVARKAARIRWRRCD